MHVAGGLELRDQLILLPGGPLGLFQQHLQLGQLSRERLAMLRGRDREFRP
jgi:hypothetical protein